MDVEDLGLAHGGGFELAAVQIHGFIGAKWECHQVADEATIKPGTKTGLGSGCDFDGEALGGLKVVPVIGELLKLENVNDIGCDERPNDKRRRARNSTWW